MDVYAVKIPHSSNESPKALISCLPKTRRDEIHSFKHEIDAQRTVLGEALLRTIASKTIGVKNINIVLAKNAFGKPFLPDYPHFHFNISHAGKWVVCAIDNLPLGIDIERLLPVNPGITRRICSKEEYEDLQNLDEKQRLSYFYELWTLKESLVKAIGRGLPFPLNSISFRIGSGGVILSPESEFREYYFRQYQLLTDYVIAVCGLTDVFPEYVNVVGAAQICEEMYSHL